MNLKESVENAKAKRLGNIEAAWLREASNVVHWWIQDDGQRGELDMFALVACLEAVDSIALPILETDPELVERIRLAIGSVMEGITDHSAPAIWNATVEEAANEVLAAISTPTPVEES